MQGGERDPIGERGAGAVGQIVIGAEAGVTMVRCYPELASISAWPPRPGRTGSVDTSAEYARVTYVEWG